MTKTTIRCLALALCLGSLVACNKGAGGGSSTAKVETEEQKTLYALGLFLGRNVKQFALKPEELEIVKAGLTDSVTGAKPIVELEEYGPKLNDLAEKRLSVGTEDVKK